MSKIRQYGRRIFGRNVVVLPRNEEQSFLPRGVEMIRDRVELEDPHHDDMELGSNRLDFTNQGLV